MNLGDGDVHFLLSGDIEQRVENDLAMNGTALAANFLKVPHHGSKTSSTDPFLAAVMPKVAVISVGRTNPFGHPVQAVLDRYAQDGVRLLRTDRDGAISAITNGRTLSVSAYAESTQR